MAKNLELTTSMTSVEVKPGETTKVAYTLTSATAEGLDVQINLEGVPAWIKLLGPGLRTLGPREVQVVEVELAPPAHSPAQLAQVKLSVVAIQRPEANWDNPAPLTVRVEAAPPRPFPWPWVVIGAVVLLVGVGVAAWALGRKPKDPCAVVPPPCHADATCTAGSAGQATCACKPGFEGDGRACVQLPPEDLIGHWSFDEASGTKVKDSSRHGFNGTHSATYVGGVRGTALHFSGQAAATIPGAPSFIWGHKGEAYTISYWLKVPAPMGNWRTILHKTTGGNCCEAGQRNPAHFMTPNDMGIHTVHGTVTNGNEVVEIKPVPTDRWFHYAETAAGDTRRNYVDGNLVMTRTVAESVGNTGTLIIGQDGFYNPLDGAIDELRVHRRALSQEELQALIRSDLSGS